MRNSEINWEIIEYEIIGEGSQFQILTNQKRVNNAFSLLIGQNLRPFPDNFVLYKTSSSFCKCLSLKERSLFRGEVHVFRGRQP